MTTESLLLTPAEGFTTEIGTYVNALAEVRSQVRGIVRDLTPEQIKRPAVPGAHPIGALLLHLGEAEWWWMQCIVSGRQMTVEDKQTAHWDILLDPKIFAAKNYTPAQCLDAIEHIRALSRLKLAAMTDTDLETIYSYMRGEVKMEHNLRWILHHLIDHEAQHKGQILLLKRLLTGNNA